MTAVYNQIVTVKKDTVAPKLVSSSVITEAGVKYLVLNFDEALTAYQQLQVQLQLKTL